MSVCCGQKVGLSTGRRQVRQMTTVIQNKGEEGKGDKNQTVLVKQQGWRNHQKSLEEG